MLIVIEFRATIGVNSEEELLSKKEILEKKVIPFLGEQTGWISVGVEVFKERIA